jgi:hypothetical protein
MFISTFLPPYPMVHVTDPATGQMATFMHKIVRPYLSMDRSGHFVLQFPGQTPILVPTVFLAPPLGLQLEPGVQRQYEVRAYMCTEWRVSLTGKQVTFSAPHRVRGRLIDVRLVGEDSWGIMCRET